MEQLHWNTLKDNIDRVISPKLVELTWFIFNYDKNSNQNVSLFNDFLEISSDDFLLWDTFALSAQVSLSNKKQEFLDLKQLIQENWKEELWTAYHYYLQNFEKIGIFFDLLSLYIPIETEKIYKFQDDWWDLTWYWGSKKSHIIEIERLEEWVFWKKISDSPDFSKKTVDYISGKYEENKNKLTQEEDNFLQGCLVRFADVTGVDKENASNSMEYENQNIVNLEDPLLSIEWLDKDILDKEISREKYIEIFSLAIGILGLEWVDVLVKDNISNISVGPSSINIPSNKDYESLTVKRIIWLISHELERHAVWNVNNSKLIWNLKSLSYLWQEEWVAHIMEHLALGYSLDSIPMNRYMPRMLAWEILWWRDFKKFLHIMNKLDGQSIDVEAFFLRFKRWKDLDLPWVNPKEKLYGQWALEVIERLRSWENPLGMFLAKNGYSEQWEINELITEKSDWKITPEMIHEKKLVLPLMLWELLRFQLLSPSVDRKWLEIWWFLRYFQTRYGKLFDNLGFSYKDFIKNHIWVQNKQNRQQVSQILRILQS